MTRTLNTFLNTGLLVLAVMFASSTLYASSSAEKPCYRIVLRSGHTVEAAEVWYRSGTLRYRRCGEPEATQYSTLPLQDVAAVYDGKNQQLYPRGRDAHTIVLVSGDTLYAHQVRINRLAVRYAPYPAGSGPDQNIAKNQVAAIFNPKGRITGRPAEERYCIVLQTGDTLLADQVELLQPFVSFQAGGANAERTVDIPEKAVRHVYDPAGRRIFPIDTSKARPDVLGWAALAFALSAVLVPLFGYGIGLFGLGALVAGWISARRSRRRRDKYLGRGRAITAAVIGAVAMVVAFFANAENIF